MNKQPIEQVKVGNVILPPERELRLWMRRHAKSQGWPETALHLTVRDIYEGSPDKTGRWIIVKCEYPSEWLHRTFNFKARPSTLWSVIA